MSTSGQFENMICEAIETLVDRAVEKAGYDKTIQASIVERTDATIGKYKVKYQDSTFFAYAADVSANYSKGTNVYILIPSNDMEKDKTIIGAVEKLGTDYIPTVPEKNKYDEVGSNFIEETKDGIGVCSYYKVNDFSFLDASVQNPDDGDQKDYFLIYDANEIIDDYVTLIAETQIEKYMKDSSYLICGATFRTKLDPTQIQETSGTYGIEFELIFKDSSDKLISKVYRIDNNDMEGFPYHFEKGSPQRVYFPIDGTRFVRINKIQLFCTKFPNKNNSKPDDIFVSNIILQGANRVSEEDLNGCYLTLNTPQGEFLGSSKGGKASVSLVASLKVKGQDISSDQNVSYYWFRENPKITRESNLFHLYGGLGWECLNKQKSKTIDGETIYDFTPLGNTFMVNEKDVKFKYITYKCVAVYNENSFSAEKTLQNNDFNYIIELATDTGQTTFNGAGTPTIICNIYDSTGTLIENPINSFDFSWAQINSNGQFTSLSTQDNKIQVNMNQILTFATYKCAIYTKKESETDNSSFIGSASIVLKNEDSQEVDLYSLVIENGSKVFKYNEAGVSPASARLDNPMIIPALSFTLYDPEGNPVEANEDVWYFPINDTMLELIYNKENPPDVDDKENPQYYIIKNPANNLISYSIAETYDPSKTNNTIRLAVKAGDTVYTETTTFLFVREGDSGTNGTDYILRILPNVSEKNAGDPLVPILTNNIAEKSYSWNYTLKNAGEALKLQIWKSEDLIYEGTDFGNISLMDAALEEGATAETNATLNWVNLIHKYSKDNQDISYINLDGTSGKAIFTGNFSNESDPANIIQARVSYDGAFFSATLPIITAEVPNTNYRIILKEGSGFTSVVYSADGMFPQYNKNTPFEIIIEKKNAVSGKWEQKFDNSEKFKYNWSIRGKVNGKDVSSDYLKNSLKTTKTSNQYWTVPVERCSAECLSVAVYCKILNEDDSVFGWIHIPIHFMLNRYGQAALNGWDGNSVDINEEGGYILSPQIGAGHKDKDNSFTGIFMGEVKEYKGTSEINHNGILGYHNGIKSLFLNAEDGSAIFGKVALAKDGSYYEGGQIILDPSTKDAVLYSANYFAPSAYGDGGKANINGEITGKGLLINLSKPEIKYGNGKFSVDSDGNLIAVDGNFKGIISSNSGDIGGWKIGKESLYHDGYTVGMGAFNRRYIANEDLSEDGNYGIQVPAKIADNSKEDGYDTTNKAVAFWAGGSLKTLDNGIISLNGANVFITHDGYFKATEAIVGAGSNPIFIGKSVPGTDYQGNIVSTIESAIYTLKKNSFAGAPSQQGFYLGKSGLSIGSYTSNGITYNGFEVTEGGVLTAREGWIGNGEEGWRIGATYLKHGKKDSSTSAKDGTYLGVNGLGLGRGIMKITYKSSLPSEEGTETETSSRTVAVPAFTVRAGEGISDGIDGHTYINRGYLAGTWKIDEKGITSLSESSSYANKYHNEEVLEGNEIPTPTVLGGGSLSPSNYAVQMLSFHLPNQIGRSIRMFYDGDYYSYQRIVAGKSVVNKDSLFYDEVKNVNLNVKKWTWELLDDGSMYARSAVVSTNRYKEYGDKRKGIYLGPEGLSIGSSFAIDADGVFQMSGIEHYYTTHIAFNSTGFILQFTNGSGKHYENTFKIDYSGEQIVNITNEDTGRSIGVSYDG